MGRITILALSLLAVPAFLAAQEAAETPPAAGQAQTQPPETQKAAPAETPQQGPAGLPDAAVLVTAGDPQAGAQKAAICATCHGPAGNSVNPAWPKLAGQNADYIFNQLQQFKKGVRQDPLMTPQAQSLSEKDMADLAAYYAAQTIKPGVADPSLVELGEKIYRGGLPETDVPACIACHGPAGRGIPAAGFPMVGGQHAQYAYDSLQAYASGERESQNGIMNDVAARMTDEQMRAVSSYLQGLHLNQGVMQLED